MLIPRITKVTRKNTTVHTGQFYTGFKIELTVIKKINVKHRFYQLQEQRQRCSVYYSGILTMVNSGHNNTVPEYEVDGRSAVFFERTA